MKYSIALASILSVLAAATDITADPELDGKLAMSATQLDRLALLPKNSDWVFDFTAQPSHSWKPGSVVNANAATFPAAVDNELTMALISLGPCSMLPPHYHPRAANYVIAMSGNTTTYMIEENGARMVTEHLSHGKMTIFPRGSLHAMANTGCSKATLVSALSNTDQGTHNVVNGLFQLPDYIVNAAFGNPEGGVKIDRSKIPGVGFGAAKGDPACLARCASAHAK